MWPKSCGGEFVVIERAGIADIFRYFMLIMANLKIICVDLRGLFCTKIHNFLPSSYTKLLQSLYYLPMMKTIPRRKFA